MEFKMKKIICATDEICNHCGEEISKGANGYTDWYGELNCEECKSDGVITIDDKWIV